MGNIFAQFPMCHKLSLFPFVLPLFFFFLFFFGSSNVPEEITSRCFLFVCLFLSLFVCFYDCLFRAPDLQARSSTQQALMFRM